MRISSAVPSDVGAEQLAVGQHVVDQRGGVDDQVDGVGQPLPGLLVQAEVGLALVAGDDLEMVGGQFPVVRAAVSGRRCRRSCRDAAAQSSSALARTRQITLPSTRSIRSSHSRAR